MSVESRRAWRLWGAGMAAILLAPAISAQSFTGSGGGPIPDGVPAGVATTFAVTGLTGEVRDVSVTLSITHTWVGDITATLISPDGLARLKLLGRTGSSRSSGFGDSSNLGGEYVFSDSAAQDFWVAAAAVGDTAAVTPATYRTTTAGRGDIAAAQRTNAGGCSTFLQLAFRGLSAAQANGTWTLLVVDGATPDTGSVTAASSVLNITTGPATPEAALFRSGFENGETQDIPPLPAPIVASSVRGTCTPGVNSITGSGLTDFILVRATAGNVTWSTKANNLTAAGTDLPPFDLGRDTDFFLMGDYDGDGISDATVWTPGNPGVFRVRRSSRPLDAPLVVAHGTTGDQPEVAADFDGDRVTDFAVYRDGTPADTTANFIIRRSSTGALATTFVPNSDGSIPFAIRDINSDGSADFGIQFNNGGGVGGFRMFEGDSGALLSPFTFGLSSDFVVPGHVVGSPVTDIAVSRNANPGTGTVKYAFPRDMETGAGDATTLATGIVFGIPGDFITQGDFDGDGLTDYSVWRSSATPGASKFVLRLSTNPGTPLEVPMGASGDYPVNNWDVH